jgi:hypothetical protein
MENVVRLIYTPPYMSDMPEDDPAFETWCDAMDEKDHLQFQAQVDAIISTEEWDDRYNDYSYVW